MLAGHDRGGVGWKGQQADEVLLIDDVDALGETLLWGEAVAEGRHAWVAGEAGWVNRLRPVVAAMGFSREQSSITGYWKSGAPRT